ncbi:hypothetical protein M569_08632, partial [Genlisea aurea]
SLPRSLSPSGRFCSSSISSSVGRFSPSVVRSDSRHGALLPRAASPTRVSLGRPVSPSPSVRFSASRRQTIASHHQHRPLNSGGKKTCLCSPTNHPGSFRCSLHKKNLMPGYNHGNQTTPYRSGHQLHLQRSAMTNSLVRIGTVEGDLVKRALASLIRPSLHSLRRRSDFVPRPSRLSLMSKA